MSCRDQPFEAGAFTRERHHILARTLALGQRRVAQAGEFRQVAGQCLDLAAQLRHDRAEQDGGTNGRKDVVRRHKHGWRRAAAQPLKGGEYLRNDVPTRGERAADSRLAVGQKAQARLGGRGACLGLADILDGLHQNGAELRPVLAQAAQLLLHLRTGLSRSLRLFLGDSQVSGPCRTLALAFGQRGGVRRRRGGWQAGRLLVLGDGGRCRQKQPQKRGKGPPATRAQCQRPLCVHPWHALAQPDSLRAEADGPDTVKRARIHAR